MPEGHSAPRLTFPRRTCVDSFTCEIVAHPGDPLDRSVAIMVRAAGTMVMVRSIRVQRQVALGTILLWIERIILLWAKPTLNEPEDVWALADECEQMIGDPF